MGTYSFLNVQATISGPGGSFSIGSTAGNSEEGISVEMLEEKDDMKVGADGTIMHTLRASDAARVTIRLLQTSPVNSQLSALYNFQRKNAGNWGQNVIRISDMARGDVISSVEAAFARQPQVTYHKDGTMREWVFLGRVDELLGAGVPDVNV
jgi:predicted SPOUT superfamily RNA methylase MTH1